MMATDGKVLFSAKFANAPTVVYDDRFFVYNDKGLLEMYTAEAEPRKIGGEYLTAGHFRKGRALVAEPGQAVKIIDTDGNTVRLLDKIQNKIISKVSTFEHGYALFQTVDYLCGAVDLDGNSVISPNYAMLVAGNGIFLAVPSQYSQAVEQGDLKKVTFCVLDTDEKSAGSNSCPQVPRHSAARRQDSPLRRGQPSPPVECFGQNRTAPFQR